MRSFFFLGTLLAISYAHAISLPAALPARGEHDSCLTNRAVCSSRKGHGKLIRHMKLPGDDLDKFMYTQIKAAKNVVFNDTSSTAFYSVLGKGAVGAVKEMCGCSALMVVSEKAIYFSHYFENLAFCGIDAPSSFQQEVLDALDKGTPHQPSLRGHASDFKGQKALAAFIMTPTTGKLDSLLYKVKIGIVEEKVHEVIGIVPKVVSYHPKDCEKSSELGTNALGTALFQHNPKQSPQTQEARQGFWWKRPMDMNINRLSLSILSLLERSSAYDR